MKNEMTKLIEILKKNNIPFEVASCWGAPQVWYPNRKHAVCDAVCHKFSFGGKDGLLEIMGLVDEEEVGDEVEGDLTAEEVANRIFEHHHKVLHKEIN